MTFPAQVFDCLDNTGKIFTKPKCLDLQAARASVFGLNENRFRKVLRQRRLANAGLAVSDDDRRQLCSGSGDLHLSFLFKGAAYSCATRYAFSSRGAK
jgi:hypothetical protein